MEEPIMVTRENYVQVFNSLKYGVNTVSYDSEEISKLFNQMISVMNEFTGKITVEERKAVIDNVVNGEYVSTEIEGLYEVIYKNPSQPITVIDNDNYRIEEIALKSKETSMVFNINNFEPALTKYAKSIASKHNVKFTGHGFNGSMKALSVRKQIEEGFLSGKYNISFPGEEFSVQTIRNHVSTYGSLIGRKFRVELSNGYIIVHFKDVEELKNLMESAKELFDKIGLKIGIEERDNFFNNLLGNTDKVVVMDSKTVNINSGSVPPISKIYDDEKPMPVPEFIPTLYGKVVTLEEYRNAENWQRTGYASKYNWENDIKGDVDMYPKDARFDDDNFGQSSDDDEDPDDDF